MGFSKSHASVNKKRVVNFTRGFGHRQGGGMGQVIVFSNHEGIKSISRIQVGILDRKLAHGGVCVLDQLLSG